MQELISAYGPRFLVAALGVSLALLCLFIVLWILRNRAPSPFVRGGRNRQPRLQVLDAAAVDTRRRIVLIRRDNVEHLVMIGGPTDIVIESGIGDERGYLSARTVNAPPLAEPQELPNAASGPSLPVSETLAPVIPSPPAAVAAPGKVPLKADIAAEAAKPETTREPERAPQVAAPMVEPPRAPPLPVGPSSSVAQRPVGVAAAPTPVFPAPAAGPAPITRTEPVPTVLTQPPPLAVTPQRVAEVEEPGTTEMTERSPFAHPSAHLEPVVSVEADTKPAVDSFEPMRAAAEQAQRPPVVQPAMTAGTPPVETFRVNPVEPVIVEPPARDHVQIASRPEAAQALPPVIDPPAAEELLEAARLRVLAPAPTAAHPTPFEPQRFEPGPEARSTVRETEQPTRDMSDFERVLEEEMALHLSADPQPIPNPAPELAQILPETRADRPRPPIAAILPEANRPPAATPQVAQQAPEANLQTEIARIFGEMSANRTP